MTPRVGQILCFHKEDLYIIITEVYADSCKIKSIRACQIYDLMFDDPFHFRVLNKHSFDRYAIVP